MVLTELVEVEVEADDHIHLDELDELVDLQDELVLQIHFDLDEQEVQMVEVEVDELDSMSIINMQATLTKIEYTFSD